jgi:hypothetical protein
MSRVQTGDTVVIKPANNIYTVLSGVALLVVILSLIAIWIMSSNPYFPGGLFGGADDVNIRG